MPSRGVERVLQEHLQRALVGWPGVRWPHHLGFCVPVWTCVTTWVAYAGVVVGAALFAAAQKGGWEQGWSAAGQLPLHMNGQR